MKQAKQEKKSSQALMSPDKARNILIDDLFKIKMLNSPEISPDGQKIVFTLKWTDLKSNGYFSNLYMYDLGSGRSLQFTSGEQEDTYPLWSPDGKLIIFRSERNRKKGLWLIPSGGGEATPLVTEKGAIGEYIWSKDGSRVFYTFRKPDPPARPEHISYDPDYKPTGEEKPYYIIESIPFKTKGGEIKPKGKFNIYSIDMTTREIEQLTDVEFDHSGLSLSPDGKKLAFCSNLDSDPIQEFENNDIYVMDLQNRKVTRITRKWGAKISPGWSSDGKLIYYTGNHAPKGQCGAEDYKLFRLPSSGGEPELLTKDFDGHVSNMLIGDTREFDDVVQPPLFLDEGKNLIFCASHHGGCFFFEIPVDGGVPRRIEDGAHEVIYYSMDRKHENIAVLRGDMLTPSEIYLYRKSGKRWEVRKLTDYNEFLTKETNIEEPEEIWHTTSEGVRLQGWLIKPPGFNPAKKYPLIHEIHGGPHILYGYCFFHEMQYFASRGYLVLFINPRGSRGYGSTFTAAVNRQWGVPDTGDQMEFLDHIIGRGFVDEKNLYLIGGSYGGYMTNWLITQTDRYRAATTLRSICNMASHFGTSCGSFHFEHTFGGVPWRDLETYRQCSPLYHVEKVKTPLLIMHAQNDHLTPLPEAEQFFTALKYLGKTARLVRFNDETHEMSRGGRPTNRRARLELAIEWFDSFRERSGKE